MVHGNLASPEGLKNINLDNENGVNNNSCIVMELEIKIEALSEKEIVIMLGCEEEMLEVKNMTYKYSNVRNSEEELLNVKRYWDDLLSTTIIKTPLESTNLILNYWLPYQTITSRLWAKSGFYQSGGAIGFRDQLQDTLGLKFISPEFMKNQILKHARHQFIEGDVEHWWHDDTKRGIRTRFSDDLLWLCYVTYEYVNMTGDYSILNENVPYISGPLLKIGKDENYDMHHESEFIEDIYIHCIRAIEKSLNFGENGLPKIGSGDWNDGMSEVGNKGIGESVWLGFFLYDILEKFIILAKYKEDVEKVEKYEKIKEDLRKALNTNGWDGRWYKRAFTDEGDVLGTMENEECKIDGISQSWAVISNAGDNDKKFICMEALENHLVDKQNGIIKLLDPPFEKSNLKPGYIKAYIPGVRENGGQYTHGAIWSILALTKLGFGDKAGEFFRMINPIEHARTKESAQKYKVEPYVIAADVYTNNNLLGRGGWTWYTGSSSWFYKIGIENILGLKIENNILEINPCIPKEWKEYSIKYKYKNTLYNIIVKNPESKNSGISKFILDGQDIKEKQIRLQNNSQIYTIEAVM